MEHAEDPGGDSVAGQRIGKYELIRRLARGGMAELFLARATGLEGFQKVCAIKRILPHLAGDADFVEMFLAEARLSATLEHPNIVQVFDFGKAGNDYFFAMPYVHGRDLLALLRQCQREGVRLPLAQALTIAIGITAGLHYTHEQVGYDGEPLGIVHRDISPANVLVTFNGHIKVADFGIAKAAAQTSVTKIGVRKGKAAYMSPEQVRGDDLDRRSDVFSVGIVLWEMITMRRLFRGDNDLAVMHRIVSSTAPPPSAADGDITEPLDAIVNRCLCPSVEQRYATTQALQQDLERFAAEHGLILGAGPLSEFLKRVFGDQEPPWASSLALGAPALSSNEYVGAAASGRGAARPGMAGDSDGFAKAAGTDHVHRTDEVTHSESLISSRGAQPWRGAVLGLGVGAVVATGLWMTSTPDPVAAPAAHAETPATVVPPPQRDLRDLLNLVNQPDWSLALPLPRRHVVLSRLEDNSALAAAIDARLNVGLDLLQAAQAPTPCEVYDDALQIIEARPDPYYVPALRAAAPPNPQGCGASLSTRRDALLRQLDTTAADADADVTPTSPIKRPKKVRKAKKRKPPPVAEPPPTKKKKRAGGLRPFGG